MFSGYSEAAVFFGDFFLTCGSESSVCVILLGSCADSEGFISDLQNHLHSEMKSPCRAIWSLCWAAKCKLPDGCWPCKHTQVGGVDLGEGRWTLMDFSLMQKLYPVS